MYDTAIRRVKLPETPGTHLGVLNDIGIVNGKIVAIAPSLGAAHENIEADGLLVIPGLVDTHLHLDKSRTANRCHLATGSLHEAISETGRIKAAFTEDDIYARAERTLQECITQGTMYIRSQVEVDSTVELRSWRAIRQLAADYRWAVDIQCCVFAQEGLTNSPEGDELLVRALHEGANVIGGAPYADPDPGGQLDRVFELARDFGVDIDLHLDLAETVEGMQLEDTCRRTIAAGMQGRVTVGHVTQMSLLPLIERERLSDLVAEAGISFTVLPATDLFLMGRVADAARPRGVLSLDPLLHRGIACSIATNNVLNAFTPYGDGSLLRMANLYANITHQASPAQLHRCLELVTTSAADLMHLSEYGLAPGSVADLICLEADTAADAIARLSPPRWGLKHGRQTFVRPAAQLTIPTRI
ncbi:amidohydrolase family protein [Gordonia sp. NPDC003376]